MNGRIFFPSAPGNSFLLRKDRPEAQSHDVKNKKERSMARILVIDDDKELCKLLVEYLTSEGFTVDTAYEGETGIEMVLNSKYGIVILDIMLPGGKSGFDVLQHLRLKTDTPIIMLTARGDDVDRIVGLEMGADDYLPKPFNPRELLARIHAVLRRSQYQRMETRRASDTQCRSGDIVLDSDLRRVWKGNTLLRLTNVEFHLLEILMRNCGTVVSRDTLSKEVLERTLLPFDRSIDVHVSKLRKKICEQESGIDRIRSIRGTGYMFVYSSPPEEDTARGTGGPCEGGFLHAET
jgi:DNA-binding response OmpR family regulator